MPLYFPKNHKQDSPRFSDLVLSYYHGLRLNCYYNEPNEKNVTLRWLLRNNFDGKNDVQVASDRVHLWAFHFCVIQKVLSFSALWYSVTPDHLDFLYFLLANRHILDDKKDIASTYKHFPLSIAFGVIVLWFWDHFAF